MDTRVEFKVFEPLEDVPISVPPSCPHLGVHEDRTTCFSYPSLGNVCFAIHKGAPISLDY